jgi:hypothetical protein
MSSIGILGKLVGYGCVQTNSLHSMGLFSAPSSTSEGFVAGWGEEGYRGNVRSLIKRIRHALRAIDD